MRTVTVPDGEALRLIVHEELRSAIAGDREHELRGEYRHVIGLLGCACVREVPVYPWLRSSAVFGIERCLPDLESEDLDERRTAVRVITELLDLVRLIDIPVGEKRSSRKEPSLTGQEVASILRLMAALDAEIDAGTGMDVVWREWRQALYEFTGGEID